MTRPLVIGLTGGIGSGKSTVAAMLGELGAELIDADQIARDVVRPGEPAYDEIVSVFGRDILAADGTIDRKVLGGRVFADPAARRQLESIVHPRIGAQSWRRISEAGARGVRVVIYEASLLVEGGLHKSFDGLIVVSASEAAQRGRVAARDGLGELEIGRRMAAQLPTSDKVAVADWVIHNDGKLEDTRRQVEAVWREIERKR